MKAVILAAGKGTRMKSLTAGLPKPMLRVAGRPVLEHIIRALASAGMRELCIVTGYRAEVIEEYFGDGSKCFRRPEREVSWGEGQGDGVHIRYIRQEVASGTGSATALAKNFVENEPFFLAYGDILTAPENCRAMVQFFNSPRPAQRGEGQGEGCCDGVVSTWRGEDLSKGGAVIVGSDGCVTDIIEKSSTIKVAQPLYNAGIYILPPQIFAALAAIQKSPRGEYELTDAIKSVIRDGGRLLAFALQGYWLDVRDPEMLKRAEKLLK